MTNQTYRIKTHRDNGDQSAANGTLQHFVVVAKDIGLAHLALEWWVFFDERRCTSNDNCRGDPVLCLAELSGEEPHVFLIVQKSSRHLAPGDFQIGRIRCGI